MSTRGLRPKCIWSALGTSAFYNRAKAEPQTEPGRRQLERLSQGLGVRLGLKLVCLWHRITHTHTHTDKHSHRHWLWERQMASEKKSKLVFWHFRQTKRRGAGKRSGEAGRKAATANRWGGNPWGGSPWGGNHSATRCWPNQVAVYAALGSALCSARLGAELSPWRRLFS